MQPEVPYTCHVTRCWRKPERTFHTKSDLQAELLVARGDARQIQKSSSAAFAWFGDSIIERQLQQSALVHGCIAKACSNTRGLFAVCSIDSLLVSCLLAGLDMLNMLIQRVTQARSLECCRCSAKHIWAHFSHECGLSALCTNACALMLRCE